MKDLWNLLDPFWTWSGLPGTPEMFGFIAVVVPILIAFGRLLWKSYMTRQVLRDLHPFYTPQEVQNATRYYVETRCQNIAPSKDQEPGRTHAFATDKPAIPFFLTQAFPMAQDDCRFYIILADSGMGKTTFLLNLYLRYVHQFVISSPPYHIRLFPLNYPGIDEKIKDVKEKEKTILLLDAFDEDNQAVQNHQDRLQTLIRLVCDFREVVITCRTQFFPTEEEEPKETGILRSGPKGGSHVFRKLYLSPFDDKDIETYLTQRFSFFQRNTRRKARQIVTSCPNLMVRPMLLSYIEDLLQSQQTYTSTYAVYAELINKWIERETEKVLPERRERYTEELYQFSREIAIDLYRRRTERQGSLMISSTEIRPFADKHGIRLSEMEMKSKSLLNRNAQGFYKFSHKSILEYFLAEEAFFNKDFRQELDFDGMSAAETFFDEMVWEKLTVPFFSRGDVSGEYCLKDGKIRVLTKLSEKILSELTYLKLTEWNAPDDEIWLFRGLKHLRWLDVGETEHYDELQHMLPTCQVFRYVSGQNIRKQFNLKDDTIKIKDKEYNILRPIEYTQNTYEDKGEIVIDKTTGLTWQKSGSKKGLTYEEAIQYVNTLNQQQFAGYSDWRLPTIPELVSLLELNEQSNNLHIDSIFNTIQYWCWSADKALVEGGSPSAAWSVSFSNGDVNWDRLLDEGYVRAVRS